ncbi:bifunctional phosphoglucose/phosphomannose isomerase [Candidatus Woesearchaeota archaeon]|nr:bifunctional phosphoglucose/phosphomannose isomerase [Candidatus Woesearchaeota archaeon]
MRVEDIDTENMKGVLERFSDMCRQASKLGGDIKIEGEVDNIVVAGMGGSGISGDILKNYLSEDGIRVYVNKDYKLPDFVNKKSLVFVISYSGNTEETIASYQDAIKKQAHIVVMCSGGRLDGMAKSSRINRIKIPDDIPQPRLAVPYLFFPMLTVLQNNKIIKNKEQEIISTIEVLKKKNFKEMAEELAPKLVNKTPIIYSSQRYASVANRWKTDINENAKIHAFYNIYPEFNHNEINGYVNKVGDFYVIIIRDNDEHYRIRKRINATKALIKRKGTSVTEMVIRGDSYLTKLLSAIYIGEWVGYFLAIEYETDPSPVDIIEDLKKQLK